MPKPSTQALARLRKVQMLTHMQSAQALAIAAQAESELEAQLRAADQRLTEICESYTTFLQHPTLDPAIAASASSAIGWHVTEANAAETEHAQAQDRLDQARAQFSQVTATKQAIGKLTHKLRRESERRQEERALLLLLRGDTP